MPNDLPIDYLSLRIHPLDISHIPTFDLKKLPPQTRQLTALYYQIGYQFANINLPILALTHRSYDSQNNYERLEFLGDALLGVIIAEALFARFTHYDEGQLTRMRASLVKEPTLAIVAKNLKLPEYLILGVGERKGGGRQRASILADTVESLIGAIYLDSGSFEVVKTTILPWFEDLFTHVETQKVLKDAKSRLQELVQAYQILLPRYELIETQGNAPHQIFFVTCHIENIEPITQSGESRRIAEQRCAEIMLLQLQQILPPLR